MTLDRTRNLNDIIDNKMDKNNKIKYFTYHGCSTMGKQRHNSPAADTKIDYIVSVLNRLGYGVDVISRASSAENKYLSSSVNTLGKNTYKYFASFGSTKLLLRIINRLLMELHFFFWCLLHIDKGEQIIVYHSLGYSASFLWLRKLKSFRIIGEIEEIYQDVSNQTEKKCRNEYEFINICEKYIFPTQLLDSKINKLHKPYTIIHGVYSTEKIMEKKFSDGKIHVVYGGTLDPNKGGAAAAAAAAAYLPQNYHVHICGFGDPKEIKEIIAEVQAKSEAIVSFEGELKGDAYKRFIQKCQIGLSTQNPDAAFNATSFPSKVLVYLSNGLKVVSIRIPAISQSAVADSLYFYDKQTPKNIADAIIQASSEIQNDNEILKDLDARFEYELNKLIEA